MTRVVLLDSSSSERAGVFYPYGDSRGPPLVLQRTPSLIRSVPNLCLFLLGHRDCAVLDIHIPRLTSRFHLTDCHVETVLAGGQGLEFERDTF